MIRSLLVAALLLAAPLAAAQDTPADPWPLVPGNTWTYLKSSSSYMNNGSGTTSPLQAETWTVLDSVETAEGRLPRVRFASGECLVRTIQTAEATRFRLLTVSGTEWCTTRLGPGMLGGFSVAPASSVPAVLTIGGEQVTVPGQRGAAEDDGASSEFFRQMADGIGVIRANGSYHLSGSGLYSSEAIVLRHAVVGGQTVGQTLATRADFWPIAAGNRWEFRVTGSSNESIGEVAWTVEAAGTGFALRMQHVRNESVVSSATCPVSVIAASEATAWLTRFDLGECALPDPALAPNLNGTATTLGIDVYAPQSLAIGTQSVTADAATGSGQLGGGPNGAAAETYAQFARGIGPTGYYANNRIGQVTPYALRAVLAYARVGGTTYGQQAVADEAGPAAAALALTAGPNPTRGALSLAFTLPPAADATVEVVDALGRTVLRHALGARPAGTGTARVALDGLAAGVYSVRLVAGEAQTSVRVSVVR